MVTILILNINSKELKLADILNKPDFRDIDDKLEAEKIHCYFIDMLKTLETNLQKRMLKNSEINHQYVTIQKSMSTFIQKSEKSKKDITEKFENILQKNENLSEKSSRVFKKLQILTKSFTSNYQNEQLFGLKFKNNAVLRNQIKENENFLRSISADINFV